MTLRQSIKKITPAPYGVWALTLIGGGVTVGGISWLILSTLAGLRVPAS